MPKTRWLVLIGIIAACGLIAAGCGDDDDSSSTEAATTEETAEDVSSEDLTLETTVSDETAEEDSSEDSGGSGEVDAEGVYQACADAVSGTPSRGRGTRRVRAGEGCVRVMCDSGGCPRQPGARGCDPDLQRGCRSGDQRGQGRFRRLMSSVDGPGAGFSSRPAPPFSRWMFSRT